MGKRRIRLIQKLYPDVRIFGVGRRPEVRTEIKKLFDIESFASVSDVDVPINCAFVCTSPLSHAGIIAECLRRGWNVFTELNLVADGYEDNIALAREMSCRLFLSSTFLYREETRYISSAVGNNKKWNYIYHIGQYLPDWHPWESYKNFFVGDARTNGCREIMAIELPWLIKAFGPVTEIHTVSDKITDLDIACHDNYMMHLTHETGNKGILAVDVVSPCAVRKLEAYTEGAYLSWGGTPESLFEYHAGTDSLERVSLCEETEHKEGYRAFIVENAYKNEIRAFFDLVLNGKCPEYGFEQDLETLKLIDTAGA